MKRRMRLLPIFWLAVVACTLMAATPEGWAIPLSATAIRIEINDTDGDAGIQIFLDGEGWDVCEITDPNGFLVTTVVATNSVGMQGITELFFESAEPSFDEQPLEDLLALFPKGNYDFDCTTTEGDMLQGHAMLTHKLPAGPNITSPPEDGVDPVLPVVIAWDPVTTAFPGSDPGVGIAGYEVIVERLSDGRKFSITVPATVTSVTVPPEFIKAKKNYKFEVLAIEASGNQTISEREFETD